MVADHDSCVQSEFGHEALGIGGKLGKSSSQGDSLLADQGAGTCAHTLSTPYRSAGWGACVERDTSRSAKEDDVPVRFGLRQSAGQSGAGRGLRRAGGNSLLRKQPESGEGTYILSSRPVRPHLWASLPT